MLSNPPKHIFALADVNDLSIDFDTVNSWVFVLRGQSFPAKHCTDILNISIFNIYILGDRSAELTADKGLAELLVSKA